MARATNHEAARDAAYQLPQMKVYFSWAKDLLDFAEQDVHNLPLVMGPGSPLSVAKSMRDALFAGYLAAYIPNQRQQVGLGQNHSQNHVWV